MNKTDNYTNKKLYKTTKNHMIWCSTSLTIRKMQIKATDGTFIYTLDWQVYGILDLLVYYWWKYKMAQLLWNISYLFPIKSIKVTEWFNTYMSSNRNTNIAHIVTYLYCYCYFLPIKNMRITFAGWMVKSNEMPSRNKRKNWWHMQ